MFSIVVALTAAGVMAAVNNSDSHSVPATERTLAGDALPVGLEVDFCPTLEQAEEHLARHGFDYKPTVPCTADGQPIRKLRDPEEYQHVVGKSKGEPTLEERETEGRARILASTRLPDADGDPTTIELMGPDGEDYILEVFSAYPDLYETTDVREIAELVFPER